MHTQEILATPARVLEQNQREHFYQEGYLVMPGLISAEALQPLRDILNRMVEKSREITTSNSQFDLEKTHSAANPRLRRVAYVDELDQACWEFCSNSIVTDVAADILGPNIRFRDVFINFKWAGGGAPVKWHQDIAFYPHTNLGTCQFLVALEDIGTEQGPLKVVPHSHKGPTYEHYDAEGHWTGAIEGDDLANVGIDQAVELTGPAGTVTVHHSNAVHGSDRNTSHFGRPVFVITYSAADAIPYTAAPYASSNYGALVRGSQPRCAHHQELHIPLPPDWSGGYTSIFSHQDEEAPMTM